MPSLRALLLCATTVLAPLAAVHAAEHSPAPIILYDAAGHPVATLTPLQPQQTATDTPFFNAFPQIDVAAARPDADPFAQLIAEQQAMMQRMMADFGAMPFATGPAGTTDVALPAGGGVASCSETIVFHGGAAGAAPQMEVHRTGNACAGMAAPVAPGAGTAVSTEPQPATPRFEPGQPMYKIEYQTAPAHTNPPLRG